MRNTSEKNVELGELEKLAETFEGNAPFDIQGQKVYGYVNKKRDYLGSLAQYTRYKTLKSKYKHVKKDIDEKDKENKEAFKAYMKSRNL